MNNLEWMYRNDKSFRDFCQWTLKEHPFTFGMVFETREDAGEWLMAQHVDANDMNARVTTMPLKMPSEIKVQYVDDESCRQDADQPKRQESPDCESDSREKLEADVLVNFGDGLVRSIIMRLLERQAAITEREIEKKWSCFSDSADGHIAELSREIGTLRAERDRYRELCGKLLDAADEMRRVRDAFDQFERCEA